MKSTALSSALTKLINLYYYFKVGYDAGIANDLDNYILTDAELSSLLLEVQEVMEGK